MDNEIILQYESLKISGQKLSLEDMMMIFMDYSIDF